VRRLVVPLQSSVTVEEKVKLVGVADARVNNCTRDAVAGPVAVAFGGGEEARVVALLHDHEGDRGLVVVAQGGKSLKRVGGWER
jgi:hypothetical protein